MQDIPARTEQFTAPVPDRPLPETIESWCQWKESGPDGDKICTLTEGHNGECKMRPVQP